MRFESDLELVVQFNFKFGIFIGDLVFFFFNVIMLVVGSFGHFQASKSGVHKGGLQQPLVKAGFVATRISVRFSVCFPLNLMLLAF